MLLFYAPSQTAPFVMMASVSRLRWRWNPDLKDPMRTATGWRQTLLSRYSVRPFSAIFDVGDVAYLWKGYEQSTSRSEVSNTESDRYFTVKIHEKQQMLDRHRQFPSLLASLLRFTSLPSLIHFWHFSKTIRNHEGHLVPRYRYVLCHRRFGLWTQWWSFHYQQGCRTQELRQQAHGASHGCQRKPHEHLGKCNPFKRIENPELDQSISGLALMHLLISNESWRKGNGWRRPPFIGISYLSHLVFCWKRSTRKRKKKPPSYPGAALARVIATASMARLNWSMLLLLPGRLPNEADLHSKQLPPMFLATWFNHWLTNFKLTNLFSMFCTVFEGCQCFRCLGNPWRRQL